MYTRSYVQWEHNYQRLSTRDNWVQRGLSVRIALCHCDASCRPPYARGNPKWTDSATRKSLKVVRFLNFGNEHESRFVERVSRGEKNAINRGMEKSWRQFIADCIFWWAVYFRDTSSMKGKNLGAQSVGLGRRRVRRARNSAFVWPIHVVCFGNLWIYES